jgi:hypothetical protein
MQFEPYKNLEQYINFNSAFQGHVGTMTTPVQLRSPVAVAFAAQRADVFPGLHHWNVHYPLCGEVALLHAGWPV